MKSLAALGLLSLVLGFGLSGCQTVEQSQAGAEITCQNAGLTPGTAAYRHCVGANFAQNRANSDATGNAVAAGAAAGIVSGAIVGAAIAGPHPCYGYGYRPYGYCGRCGFYGCY
jgi:hypothetical protein